MQVELTINPQEAVLPSSPPQGYECDFYYRNHENVSYGFTAPFSDGACQIPEAEISDFEGKFIGNELYCVDSLYCVQILWIKVYTHALSLYVGAVRIKAPVVLASTPINMQLAIETMAIHLNAGYFAKGSTTFQL